MITKPSEIRKDVDPSIDVIREPDKAKKQIKTS